MELHTNSCSEECVWHALRSGHVFFQLRVHQFRTVVHTTGAPYAIARQQPRHAVSGRSETARLSPHLAAVRPLQEQERMPRWPRLGRGRDSAVVGDGRGMKKVGDGRGTSHGEHLKILLELLKEIKILQS